MSAAPILGREQRLRYTLGGNARVTLVGRTDRYTYRVRLNKAGTAFWVSALTGADNEHDFSFFGVIDAENAAYKHAGAKAQLGVDAPSVRAWAWFWGHLDSEAVEVWHEGKCSKCGRALTDPESIQTGIGPTCRKRKG